MNRKVKGETQNRTVEINGTWYQFEKNWHYLANGDRYYFIHVYRHFSLSRPIKRFAWTVSPNGKVTHR